MTGSSGKNYARIFVAFPIPSLKSEELKVIQWQNNSLTGIRWTPFQNLHVTIFFLGEVLEETISSINDAIHAATNKTKPFELEFEKITPAGKLKHGGMIWTQFYKNDFYFNLSTGIYHAVKSFLLTEPVLKDPIPHITLARFRKEVDFNEINLSFENSFTLSEINFCELWRTIQTKEGVRYKCLERFEFGK
jgi:2'-5' RNA ligase